MAIDPSIALGVKPVQLENPLDAYAKVAQFKQMQQQNRLADLMFGEKQREVEEGNALNQLYKNAVGTDGQIDRNKLYTGMAQGGLGAKLPAIQKTFAEQDRSLLEAEKAKLETGLKRFEMSGQIMAGVKDQASWDLARQQTAKVFGPEVAAQLPEVYDPALVEQKRLQALTVKDQLEQKWKALNYTLDQDKFTYQQTNDKVNRDVTIRGQNLVDARGRRANELKEQENSINQQGIVGKKVQDVELKLQDDYRNESKGFSETSTAMKKILGAITTADKNPGSALAAGTAFMKLLDPNSVVRESELGMALNASGWFDRALNVANTLQSGKVMTATQKANLKKAAETLFEEAKAAQREVDAAYEQRAKAYGADPSRVIVDRGQRGNQGKSATQPAKQSGGKVIDFNDL
jgi:hypothetical protein